MGAIPTRASILLRPEIFILGFAGITLNPAEQNASTKPKAEALWRSRAIRKHWASGGMANKRKELNIEGTNLWYLVGLITSDGCLSSDGRHIDVTSKDYEFLQSIKNRYGFTNKVCNKYNSTDDLSYHFQLANRSLYDFLLSIGLSPRKSLTIKTVNVPINYFCDFLRGLIDGDGGIQRWINRSNGKEQWNLRVSSGSNNFLSWLKNKVEEAIGAKGKIYSQDKNQFRLKYGKMAAKEIIKRCYYKNCFGLARKIKLANECLGSVIGWSKSKTVLNRHTSPGCWNW